MNAKALHRHPKCVYHYKIRDGLRKYLIRSTKIVTDVKSVAIMHRKLEMAQFMALPRHFTLLK